LSFTAIGTPSSMLVMPCEARVASAAAAAARASSFVVMIECSGRPSAAGSTFAVSYAAMRAR
jgi:hypothetical protein